MNPNNIWENALLGGLTSLLCLTASGQTLKGTVIDRNSLEPISGATICVLPQKKFLTSDNRGQFTAHDLTARDAQLVVTCIGYDDKTIDRSSFTGLHGTIVLDPKRLELREIVIVPGSTNPYKPISQTDIALRGVNNAQEVLRIIPGIVIGQHQGGGKAEQIFLRGFDCDHGTDFREDVDGLPINMVSHAHGQGFADSHFIIPETIGTVNFGKGPYQASKGDFATTGHVDYTTKTEIPSNLIKLEAGMFNTYRVLAMINLLSSRAKLQERSWYVAGEARYSDSYFDYSQHFKRFNLFSKYQVRVGQHTLLTASATAFSSTWDASGQIPERAVTDHRIGYFGALDPNEGGITQRVNGTVQLTTTLPNGDILRNELFGSRYGFDLHTNFTFFLVDSVNGDEIRQREHRTLAGYNGSYTHQGQVGQIPVTTEAGINVRGDLTQNSELSHTVNRYTLINRIKLGDVGERDLAGYVAETFHMSKRLTVTAGLRFDEFMHRYTNKFAGDTTLSGAGVYRAGAGALSPKLNIYYQASEKTQLYLTSGKGFHSNDTRAVVLEHGTEILPSAYGTDLGAVIKPAKNFLFNAALWYSLLEQEFVYSGDGGTVDFSGKTERYGFDVSARYEPVRHLFLDIDLNYAHGRALGVAKTENYIPLAPVWTSTGGITYNAGKGLNGSFRYRYISDRPANEDYSLTAVGYFVTDFVLNYTRPKYEIGLTVNNVFNTKWKETQFDTETRLRGETQSVNEVCFTPGTPFAVKLSYTVNF